MLLAANSLPLAGVLLFDWSVFDVVLLYWIENVVIGVINILRMLSARPDPELWPGRVEAHAGVPMGAVVFLSAFFTVHYGFFCWGHLQFLLNFFGDERGSGGLLTDPVLWLSVAAIAGSHLFSYVSNFLGSGEYQRTSAARLMGRPYGRIIVLHLTIIIGGFLVTLLNNNLFVLLTLIAVKTVVDLRQHVRERDLLAAA